MAQRSLIITINMTSYLYAYKYDMLGISNIMGYVMAGLGLTLLLALGGFYWYYHDSQKTIALLNQDKAKLETAITVQKGFITYLQDQNDKQNQAVTDLSVIQIKNQIEKQELETKLRKHDLEKLARVKPKLLVDQINKSTILKFKEIENETKPSK